MNCMLSRDLLLCGLNVLNVRVYPVLTNSLSTIIKRYLTIHSIQDVLLKNVRHRL